MKRIIGHWTAGADGVIAMEADSYNYIVSRDGTIHVGVPVNRQIPPLINGAYAAHTFHANSYSIGVALDAMAGAWEKPFNAGQYPITEIQVESFVTLIADLCKQYDIPVTRKTVLTHAEVEITLGIKQRNKWDITWLPGMKKPGDPVALGDVIRKRVLGKMRPKKPWWWYLWNKA